MKNKDPINLYYYKCPKNLGYLEIGLDTINKVKSCIFIDEKERGDQKNENKNQNLGLINLNLPIEIKLVLDDYFYNKKDLPSNFISKEIIGTEFQKIIWRVILGTKFGETVTYTDMAVKAGKSDAARAAGTACGKNPLALFIPCHRVIRKQNEDYGYSWGVDRKKWLLNFESVSF